jgi:glycine cleavage system H protein
MTILLVLLTFVTLIAIDYFTGPKAILPTQEKEVRPAAPRPSLVNGFALPATLKYHPGHTWVMPESSDMVRCGIDDLAAKLIGKTESVQLPQRGQWVRQGQKLASFVRNGVAVDVVSPIEGTVTDINEAAVKSPELITKDSYGDGWLVSVQAPDAKTNFRNLLSGEMARSWMTEAANRLALRLNMNPATMQDGGVAAENLGAELKAEVFAEAAKEFFLV